MAKLYQHQHEILNHILQGHNVIRFGARRVGLTFIGDHIASLIPSSLTLRNPWLASPSINVNSLDYVEDGAFDLLFIDCDLASLREFEAAHKKLTPSGQWLWLCTPVRTDLKLPSKLIEAYPNTIRLPNVGWQDLNSD